MNSSFHKLFSFDRDFALCNGWTYIGILQPIFRRKPLCLVNKTMKALLVNTTIFCYKNNKSS